MVTAPHTSLRVLYRFWGILYESCNGDLKEILLLIISIVVVIIGTTFC